MDGSVVLNSITPRVNLKCFMMKMESKKSRRLRWLDCFSRHITINSKWLQENLEKTNQSVGRKLKMIEDSDAESFAEKVEMYNESRQELNNLVDKCYNHGRGELLNNIPNSGLTPSQISISNVSSGPHLCKLRSSKLPNAPECWYATRELKRGVSGKVNRFLSNFITKKCDHVLLRKYYSDTESDDDDGKEGSDELEADLRDMIEKLCIQMEWDRVVSMLQHRILRPYEDDGQVKESVSSNVDKALLEETLELHGEICRRLKEMSYLEEYNEEINATNLVASLFELALSKCWCF